MGRILKSKMATWVEVTGLLIVLGIGVFLADTYLPGLGIKQAILGESIAVDGSHIDNVTETDMLDLPSTERSTMISSTPELKLGVYAWNAQSGIISANGGPKTTKGSLMEQNGVNLTIIRQDWLSELKNMVMNFVVEFDKGNLNPKGDKAVNGIIVMGDGAPFVISTAQKELDDKFGKDKYHLVVVGAVGISYGEDKLIGPMEWKTNPKSMLGKVISVVIGDGDWVTVLNYCFANGLKVNPDFTTYDSDAVNFYPSENDDYMKSAEELIKSQKGGFKVKLKEIKNGKLTGDIVTKQIDGCATWTPGDKKVFDELSGFTDIVSTKEFNNQMPTTIIMVKEWAEKNRNTVSNMLKASFIASNQMKLYDSWRIKASECVAATYNIETPQFWYDMFRGQSGEKNGVKFNVGGSRVFNLADAKQYYGLGSDGVSRYKSVYNQISNYLTTLNPYEFNSNVDRVTSFEDAVDLSYIKNINISDSEVGDKYESNYNKEATNVVANGDWRFNFALNSSDILSSSNSELDKLYNLLIQAEDSKIIITGYTDSSGNVEINKRLSLNRAYSVKEALIRRGISTSRIQEVKGLGSKNPLADNSTNDGRALNRRTEVTILN